MKSLLRNFVKEVGKTERGLPLTRLYSKKDHICVSGVEEGHRIYIETDDGVFSYSTIIDPQSDAIIDSTKIYNISETKTLSTTEEYKVIRGIQAWYARESIFFKED